MGLLEAIKSAVPLIVANYNHPSNCERSKQVMADLINDIETKSACIERLYLMYNIIELVERLSEGETSRFFSTIFPSPLKKDASSFIYQLVSLSLTLHCPNILSACAGFIAKNQISFPGTEIQSLPDTLASESPSLVTTILNRGILENEHIFTPRLITAWLSDVIHNPSITTFNGESVINYSLLGPGAVNGESVTNSLLGPGVGCAECVERSVSSQLHFKLLQVIEMRKIQTLTPQYVVDLAVLVTGYKGGCEESNSKESNSKGSNSKGSNSKESNSKGSCDGDTGRSDRVAVSKEEVIERFCQILFVSFESGILAKFPNSLKKKMNNLFPNHELMASCMKYR